MAKDGNFVLFVMGLVVILQNAEGKSAQLPAAIAAAGGPTDERIQQFLDNLTHKAYPAIRPNAYGHRVIVTCSMLVEHIGPTDENEMTYDLDMYLRYSWTDSRLAFASSVTSPGRESSFTVPHDYIHKFWVPDIVFLNMDSGKSQDITKPNEFYRIYPNGTVLYSSRLSLVVICNMDLAAYPFDAQVCPLQISSYMYTDDQVSLDWSPNPIQIRHDNLQLATEQVDLSGYHIDYCQLRVTTGLYSCIVVHFHLRRHPGYVVLQTYVPTVLVVIVSWLTFWIHPDFISARASLCGTTIITMATVFISKTNIRVSYAKAVDYWVTFCMVFVFLAFMESILISYMHQRIKKAHQRRVRSLRRSADGGDGTTAPATVPQTSYDSMDNTRGDKKPVAEVCYGYLARPSAIDRVSRAAFPAAFILYNVIYWAVLLSVRQTPEDFEWTPTK